MSAFDTSNLICSIPIIEPAPVIAATSPKYIATPDSQNYRYRPVTAENYEQYAIVIPKNCTKNAAGIHVLHIKQKTCVVELKYDPPTGILLPCILDDSTFVPYVMYGTSQLKIDLSFIPE